MIITFFGHSSYCENTEDEQRLLNHIEKVADGNQIDFYIGWYGDFDNFALKCAKKYKEKHADAKIIFITPYIDKNYARLDNALRIFDETIYPKIENTPKRFAISKRNEWMIDKADYIFFYVFLHFGGAYNALRYAHKNNKPYVNLYKGNYELYWKQFECNFDMLIKISEIFSVSIDCLLGVNKY